MPQGFNDKDKEAITSSGSSSTKYRKSQLATSPLAIHRLRRASQRVNVQIYSSQLSSSKSDRLNGNKENFVNNNNAIQSVPFFNDEFEILSHPSPRTPETPIKTVKFFDNDSIASSNINGYSSDLQQNSQSNGYRANRSISNESGGDVTTVL